MHRQYLGDFFCFGFLETVGRNARGGNDQVVQVTCVRQDISRDRVINEAVYIRMLNTLAPHRAEFTIMPKARCMQHADRSRAETMHPPVDHWRQYDAEGGRALLDATCSKVVQRHSRQYRGNRYLRQEELKTLQQALETNAPTHLLRCFVHVIMFLPKRASAYGGTNAIF